VPINGLDELLSRLKKANTAIRPNVAKAVYQFAEEVMEDSKNGGSAGVVVPVLTGALMNSGKVLPPTDNGSQIEVVMGYGDESAPYALYVHEELDAKNGGAINWTRPGSGPKYLTRPLESKQSELPQRCADAVNKAFGV